MKSLFSDKPFCLVVTIFFLLFGLNTGFWAAARHWQAEWANVPPAPSYQSMNAFSLGDSQLSYRMTGLLLQNFGNTGGREISPDRYDYKNLSRWFFLADRIDSQSNFVPFLAAYYFSATHDRDNLSYVIDYLAQAGRSNGAQKWRWMGQAVFLARYQKGDMDQALKLALELAGMWRPGRPGWMRQMPVFITAAMGDKEAAMSMMLGILKEEGDSMDPAEVNFMVGYICERLLDKQQAAGNPLCK